MDSSDPTIECLLSLFYLPSKLCALLSSCFCSGDSDGPPGMVYAHGPGGNTDSKDEDGEAMERSERVADEKQETRVGGGTRAAKGMRMPDRVYVRVGAV